WLRVFPIFLLRMRRSPCINEWAILKAARAEEV
uniref:Uncharacterized protein n=1 Tax=Amphimedon queenslandica TaxID=400682 RepID=A0A1X7TKS1_AMPQE